jgi:dTMP kinase
MFISFEGLDGCGKTTQAKRLADYLTAQGHDVMLTREPGGTQVGEAIRNLLLSNKSDMSPMTEAILYAASRAEMVDRVIRPALDAGKTVICDRFVDSSLAYQGVMNPVEDVHLLSALAMRGTQPNLTFYLNVPAETAYERIASRSTGKDRIEARGLSYFRRVKANYDSLRFPRIVEIDGTRSEDDVFASIVGVLDWWQEYGPEPITVDIPVSV